MNKLDFYASEVHYFDHIVPVWNKLGKEYKGIFYVSEDVMKKRLGAKKVGQVGLPTSNITLVASYKDYLMTKGEVILMEHGIGHNYGNRHPAYVGGLRKERVVLFLNQHHLSQDANDLAYPKTLGKVIGTPKMDTVKRVENWHKEKPVVCISFHWDCQVCPNTRSAFYYYKGILTLLSKAKEYTLIAHGHPRGDWSYIKQLGIPFYEDISEVFEIADIYANDNSSTMYEFIAAGKPVVVLNCPLYDRNANTGIRFWKYIGGIQVNKPSELHNAILETIRIDPYKDIREQIATDLYPFYPKASKRASEVITEFLNDRKDK